MYWSLPADLVSSGDVWSCFCCMSPPCPPHFVERVVSLRPVLMRFSSSGSIRSPASAQRMAASSSSAAPGGRPDSDPRIWPNYETGLQRSGNDRPELGHKSHGRSPNRSTGLAMRRWRRQGESTWKSTGLSFSPVGNAALGSAVTVATQIFGTDSVQARSSPFSAIRLAVTAKT
jgi:hypothetical protein